MTTRIRIQPYAVSNSARLICNSLNDLAVHGCVMRLKRAELSRYIPRHSDIIINWGSSRQRFPDHHYINKPSAIGVAANKLRTFQVLEAYNVAIPEFYTAEGEHTLHDGYDLTTLMETGRKVYARTNLSGHSGAGIVVMETPEDFIRAPLYTVDTQADQEYRIHVVKRAGTYTHFDVQQKRRRNGVETSDEIRNHANGWVFCREGVVAPQTVVDNAVFAAEAIGLDFCGVDVGYKSDTEEAFVYEVNTACGLEGTTLVKYTEMLDELLKERYCD